MGLGAKYDFVTKEKKIVPGPGSYTENNTISLNVSKLASSSPAKKELVFG